jgi:hypothetical protein
MQTPKRFARPLLAFLTLIGTPLFAGFPVGSDQFADAPAIEFVTGVSDPTDLSSYTAEPSEPAHHPGGEPATHSAWWKWSPVVPGICTVDTLLSSLVPDHAGNTAIAVYIGNSLTTLQAVARNDDSIDSALSQASFFALPGTTYYIAVDCPAVSSGPIVLRLRQLVLQDGEWVGVLKPSSTSTSFPGLVSIKTTRNGLLTGQLSIGARRYPFKGGWGPDGRFRMVFPQLSKIAELQALPVELIIDGAGNSFGLPAIVNERNDSISGTLGRVTPFTTQNPAPERGNYTVTVLDTAEVGAGAIRYTVSPTGRVKGSGFLGDGQPVAFGSVLTEPVVNNTRLFAVHLPLFNGIGYFNGYFYCTPAETGTFEMNYLRPQNPGALFYPLGFVMDVTAYGSLYSRPQRGQRVLGLLDPAGNGAFMVGQAGTEINGFSEAVTLGIDNKFRFSNPALRRPALRVDPATGLITGSVIEPAGTRRKLRGIVARVGTTTYAYGYVSGTTRTAWFGIEP